MAARREGAEFNLFEILGLSTDEVRGHSAFIAELLNPSGSHGQGDRFIRLFLKRLTETNPSQASFCETLPGIWRVEIEQRFKGGRIDILLENGETWVIIENKIYAGDQDLQLCRYSRHAAASRKRAILVYLTPDGRDPLQYSLGDLKVEEVLCVGYDGFIDGWLDECRTSVDGLPALREPLRQYQNLVRRICGRGVGKELTMELSQYLQDSARLEAACEIAAAAEDAKVAVHLAFWRDLREELDVLGIPMQSLKDFAPTPEDVHACHKPIRPRGYQGVGLTMPLCDFSAGRRLVMLVTVYERLHVALTVAEGECWDHNMSGDERRRIRAAFTAACGGHELQEGEWSEWTWLRRRLYFRAFGRDCVALADASARRQIVKEIAQEIGPMWKNLKDAVADAGQ